MAVVEDNRGGRAPVAALDEARKRREQRTDPDLTPSQAEPGELVEDLSGYALGLADSVSGSDDELDWAVSPHATPAEHERSPEHASGLPESFERAQPTAEELLHELQADRDRAQRTPTATIPVAHREPSDDHLHGAVSTGARGRRDRAPISRRTAAIACTVIAIATVVPILTIASNSNRLARGQHHQPLAAATTTPASDGSPKGDRNLRTLAAANYQARENGKPQRRASSARPRRHRRAHPQGNTARVKHAGTMHAVNARSASTTATSAPASSEQSTTSPSASVASSSSSSTQQSSNTPPPSQPAATQPAGPTGYGHVVGSNCNPQCH